MEMTTYKPLTKHEMIQAFPESLAAIMVLHSMKELRRVLHHLIDCSQCHESEDNNGLNLLHICLQKELYRAFVSNPAAQVYPQQAADTGSGPVYTPNQD